MSTSQRDKGQIFNSAAERKDPTERAAYLDQACGEDRQLRSDPSSTADGILSS